LSPIHESDEDRRNEEDIIKSILSVNRKGLSYKKLPMSYRIDYAITEGGGSFPNVIAFVEVKDKRAFKAYYETVMCDVSKWQSMVLCSCATGLPCWFAVRTPCWGVGVIKARPAEGKYGVKHGGRTDRDDPTDREACLSLPIRDFRKPEGIFIEGAKQEELL